MVAPITRFIAQIASRASSRQVPHHPQLPRLTHPFRFIARHPIQAGMLRKEVVSFKVTIPSNIVFRRFYRFDHTFKVFSWNQHKKDIKNYLYFRFLARFAIAIDDPKKDYFTNLKVKTEEKLSSQGIQRILSKVDLSHTAKFIMHDMTDFNELESHLKDLKYENLTGWLRELNAILELIPRKRGFASIRDKLLSLKQVSLKIHKQRTYEEVKRLGIEVSQLKAKKNYPSNTSSSGDNLLLYYLIFYQNLYTRSLHASPLQTDYLSTTYNISEFSDIENVPDEDEPESPIDPEITFPYPEVYTDEIDFEKYRSEFYHEMSSDSLQTGRVQDTYSNSHSSSDNDVSNPQYHNSSAPDNSPNTDGPGSDGGGGGGGD